MSTSVPAAGKSWVFHIAKVSGWAKPADGGPQPVLSFEGLAVGISFQAAQVDIRIPHQGVGHRSSCYRILEKLSLLTAVYIDAYKE